MGIPDRFVVGQPFLASCFQAQGYAFNRVQNFVGSDLAGPNFVRQDIPFRMQGTGAPFSCTAQQRFQDNLAYLRNRDATETSGPQHEGILLYPTVDERIAVDVRLEGFSIKARSVNLAQDWQNIHGEMLELIA